MTRRRDRQDTTHRDITPRRFAVHMTKLISRGENAWRVGNPDDPKWISFDRRS